MKKKIIIIGASSGIGSELARLYAGQGHLVGITGRRKELLEALQKEFPAQLHIACFDVTAADNISHLLALINAMNGLDLLIYNSGYGEPSDVLDPEIEKRTTTTNVNGFIELVSYSFNYFVQQGHGQIAATSSVASVRGNGLAPAYSASKAFMSTYMEGLQLKTHKDKLNIAITDIQPGFIKTKMAKGHGQFWVAPVEKAALQIFTAIEKKKRRAYITRRWALVAWLMKQMPYAVYRRIVAR